MKPARDADDWSCPHGSRWIRWPGGWMNVASPMEMVDGEPMPVCECRPATPGPWQPIAREMEE